MADHMLLLGDEFNCLGRQKNHVTPNRLNARTVAER